MLKAKYDEEHRCPLCGSKNVEYGISDYEADYIDKSVTCKDCGAGWTETILMEFYSTSGITDKDGKEYKPEWEE